MLLHTNRQKSEAKLTASRALGRDQHALVRWRAVVGMESRVELDTIQSAGWMRQIIG